MYFRRVLNSRPRGSRKGKSVPRNDLNTFGSFAHSLVPAQSISRLKAIQKLASSAQLAPQFQHTFPSSEQPNGMPPMPEQRPPLAQQNHSRSSSFFSFRKGNGDSGTPQRTLSLLGRSQSNGNSPGNGALAPQLQNQNPTPAPPQTQGGQSLELTRTVSGPPQAQTPQLPAQSQPLHPEIRSIVGLTVSHAHKIYFSGPLVRRIERQPDGQRPAKDEGWTDVWAQLGGTTLSIWDMKQVQEASQQGREVPPTYVNMTDAFVQVLGSVTVPATASAPAKRYTDVLTLNTAGSNLLLFSCPSTSALISWAAALRLSAWEKARLEEIYTAHLIRITLSARDVASTLTRGRMEGWVRIRVAGQTDWKKVWMVIANAQSESQSELANAMGKKKRMSSLFSRDLNPNEHGPSISSLLMYASPKPKDKRRPILTMTNVTQAFAVYPERPELISRSTLIKVEGLLGSEDTAAAMRSREGWLLIMPELEGGLAPSAEMLKWVVGLHDAFQLYGRPQAWTWDPRDPVSLMFAYPVGPSKDLLFLEREAAESLDPRDDRTSTIRSRLLNIAFQRLPGGQPPQPGPPSTGTPNTPSNGQASGSNGFQLPPLSFDTNTNRDQVPERTLLTPITERSSVLTHGRTLSTEGAPLPRQSLNLGPSAEAPTIPEESVLGNNLSQSPSGSPRLGSSIGPPIPAKDDSSVPVFPDEDRHHLGSTSNGGIKLVNPTLLPSTQTPPSATPPPIQFNSVPALVSPHSVSGHSTFTSPHSPKEDSSLGRFMMSPHSPSSSPSPRPSLSVSQSYTSGSTKTTQSVPLSETEDSSFTTEAGALYYMQYDDNRKGDSSTEIKSQTTERESLADTQSLAKSTSTTSVDSRNVRPLRLVGSPPKEPDQTSPTSRSGLTGLGRKPSGARAPGSRGLAVDSRLPSHHQVVEEESEDEEVDTPPSNMNVPAPPPLPASSSPVEDHNLDALAALSYLDVNDEPSTAQRPKAVDQAYPRSPTEATRNMASDNEPTQFKSSFAPTKQVAERLAKAQAQQAAQQAAAHRPGRAQGRRKLRAVNQDAWNDSSEEEDEDEEDEDEDDEPEGNSLGNQRRSKPQQSPLAQSSPPPSHTHTPPQDLRSTPPPPPPPSHLRPPRTLPQIPASRGHADDYRRQGSDQNHSDGRRTYYEDGTPIRTQAEFPQPGAARQSVWSQVLDPNHTPGAELPNPGRDTFVQLEPQSQAMTKAFTPQGLLSAGLQDKQDRSAKRQEELARETGASLINVPNKPPPPQTGLLGAITAHERERKREGGVGAALTEREREKRLAEERQRRFDDHQRQQLDQMQQGGMFNPYASMMNPMMMGMMNPMMTGGGLTPIMTGNGQSMNPMMTGQGMNPMMTGQGMNPMMTGQGMNPMMTGFPGMMPYNPQHMFAAQQAAQAYQQAMVAFSVAGSQVGGEGGGGGGSGGGTPAANPMMMGGMGGFDPRMSMMGMPMMTPMGGPMQMQMTGMSGFDPRFGPSNDAPLVPPGPGQFHSNTSSPVGRGSPVGRSSPLARPFDSTDTPPRSRPGTPKLTQ